MLGRDFAFRTPSEIIEELRRLTAKKGPQVRAVERLLNGTVRIPGPEVARELLLAASFSQHDSPERRDAADAILGVAEARDGYVAQLPSFFSQFFSASPPIAKNAVARIMNSPEDLAEFLESLNKAEPENRAAAAEAMRQLGERYVKFKDIAKKSIAAIDLPKDAIAPKPPDSDSSSPSNVKTDAETSVEAPAEKKPTRSKPPERRRRAPDGGPTRKRAPKRKKQE